MRVEIDFDGLTWGELRHFVALAQHVDDDDQVDLAYDHLGNYEPAGFWVTAATPRRAED